MITLQNILIVASCALASRHVVAQPSPVDLSAAFISNTPTTDGKPKLLVTQSMPDFDIGLLNPKGYLSEAELAAFPSACEGISKGQICRTRPGIGSGLHFNRLTKVFYATTDRGPNQDCKDLAQVPEFANGINVGKEGKGFPIPKYSPTMLSIAFSNITDSSARLRPIKPVNLKKANGQPAVGIPNANRDDTPFPFGCNGSALSFDPSGLDVEDLQMFPDFKTFIAGDENAPSVFIFNAAGEILMRYVPSNLTAIYLNGTSVGYPVKAILPAVVSQRRLNRGFENVALSADGKFAWAILQSPLGTEKQQENSLIIRAVKLDVSNPVNAKYIGMFAFQASNPADYKRDKAKPKDLKYSAAYHLEGEKLLLVEHAKAGTKVFVVDFTEATNLQGKFDESLALEQNKADMNALGVKLATRTKVLDSDDLPPEVVLPEKIEGVAPLTPATIALIDDNDFGLENNKHCAIRFFQLPTTIPGVEPLDLNRCDFQFCAGDDCFVPLPSADTQRVMQSACELMGGQLKSLPEQAAAVVGDREALLRTMAGSTVTWLQNESPENVAECAVTSLNRSTAAPAVPAALHRRLHTRAASAENKCSGHSSPSALNANSTTSSSSSPSTTPANTQIPPASSTGGAGQGQNGAQQRRNCGEKLPALCAVPRPSACRR
ncbi:hypothetical protein HK102_013816 [Quaeritorhiza haematococci]|nr:hypothetical protein HK102_013816 [Quaeritorhiza haematococci]